ncbi:hypothetical protein Zm00014a_020082 [Zea mays]|uniref:Uncharacterized protein n=2 Tax=Zea mays TaxID=4577 RepID=A0A8J8XNJ1_MAIZE|nr:Putative E3 ubiquitin-protein ligase RING1a [Zea mays]PWZ32260.1 hypothetical protein Zm00014a_020082 [Zea mays]
MIPKAASQCGTPPPAVMEAGAEPHMRWMGRPPRVRRAHRIGDLATVIPTIRKRVAAAEATESTPPANRL